MITAFVLIQAEADTIPEAAQAIADLDAVDSVYSCAGDVDLIAIVKVTAHEELAELVPGRISKVPGVLTTDTHIAFRSYSRAVPPKKRFQQMVKAGVIDAEGRPNVKALAASARPNAGGRVSPSRPPVVVVARRARTAAR